MLEEEQANYENDQRRGDEIRPEIRTPPIFGASVRGSVSGSGQELPRGVIGLAGRISCRQRCWR
jgi:hypothetical protein